MRRFLNVLNNSTLNFNIMGLVKIEDAHNK